MTSSQLASHTIFIFVNVTLVVAGFVLKGQPQNCSGHSRVSSSLKDLQCIAVCEVDVSSVIQNKYHSPVEWAGCRVTDSHPSTNEPCRQTYAAHGRPRLSYREHHWIAPMGLTAVQPGPWLRPVNYSPSQNNKTDQARPTDIRLTQEDHENEKTNSGSKPPPNEEERDTGRVTGEKEPLGAPRLSRL